MEIAAEKRTSWLDRPLVSTLTINAEVAVMLVLIVLAVGSRFYNLGARVMSHDENSHVYYSWLLYKGQGYTHDPITHGPLQFHLVALSYFLFGDNDFTARIPAALFSIATVAFLWFYRRYLGRVGTLVAAGLMLISPYMLFYGRYVRNEAYVAFFGVVLLWGILRYLETGKPLFMYIVTLVTVLHFTTKETAFIYTAQALIFLGLYFLWQVTGKKWQREGDRKLFLGLLVGGAAVVIRGGWGACPHPPGVCERSSCRCGSPHPGDRAGAGGAGRGCRPGGAVLPDPRLHLAASAQRAFLRHDRGAVHPGHADAGALLGAPPGLQPDRL